MKRPAHPPIVLVEWHDSRTLTSGWRARERVLDEAPADYDDLIVSAGFLIERRKRYVVLAVGLAPNGDVAHVLQIPRSEIARVVVVKRKRT